MRLISTRYPIPNGTRCWTTIPSTEYSSCLTEMSETYPQFSPVDGEVGADCADGVRPDGVSTSSSAVPVKTFVSGATILPRIRQGHDPTKGRDMARTRYQYGEIVVKHGKAHDSYMGRWKEDVRLRSGCIARRKRSRVLGIFGQI